MLIYHPIYDINHCVYRVLRIFEVAKNPVFRLNQIRLLDFYSLFPHLLKKITPFPRELGAYKKIISRIPDAYESMPNEKRIFHEMLPIQNTAIQNLVAKNLIDAELFRKKVVSRTIQQIPEEIGSIIKSDSVTKEEWYDFLVNQLPLLEFDGKKGIKSRTDLLEFRYDA